MLRPRLHFLEGAEGSQVVIYPRQSRQPAWRPPACDPHATGHYRVYSHFPLQSTILGVRGQCRGTTHFFLQFFCKTPILPLGMRAQARLADFLNPLLPVSESTKPRGAAPGWEKHPIFAEGSLTVSSEHPRAVWDAAVGGGAQPHARIQFIPGTRRAPDRRQDELPRLKLPISGNRLLISTQPFQGSYNAAACLGRCQQPPSILPWGQQLPEERGQGPCSIPLCHG